MSTDYKINQIVYYWLPGATGLSFAKGRVTGRTTRDLHVAFEQLDGKRIQTHLHMTLRPTELLTSTKAGTRVRFTLDSLGASTPDDLGHVVADTYGVGDEGVVAFDHPNPKLSAQGWVYVEVNSKVGTPRKLYVGAGPKSYYEELPAAEAPAQAASNATPPDAAHGERSSADFYRPIDGIRIFKSKHAEKRERALRLYQSQSYGGGLWELQVRGQVSLGDSGQGRDGKDFIIANASCSADDLHALRDAIDNALHGCCGESELGESSL